MLSRFAYLLLALTSVAPVALVYGASRFQQSPVLACGFFGYAIVLCWLCYEILGYAKKHAEIEPLNIASIRSANHEVLGFFLTYLIPLLIRDDSGGTGQPLAILVFLSLVTIMVLRGNLLHVNPLIGLLGYQFYEVTSTAGYTYLLVTKSKNNQLTGRRGAQLSSALLLEV